MVSITENQYLCDSNVGTVIFFWLYLLYNNGSLSCE